MRNAGLASIASSSISSSGSTSNPSQQPGPSSSILQHLRHPVHKNKRRASDSLSPDNNNGKAKRPRSSEPIDVDEYVDSTGEVQANPQPRKQQEDRGPGRNIEEKLNPMDTIDFFRVNPDQLRQVFSPHIRCDYLLILDMLFSRKKEYQILYFPLDEPLCRQKQLARKEVRSISIC